MSKIIRSAKKVEIARLAEIKHEAAGPKDFLSDPLDSASAELSDEEILSRAESEARRVLADARNQVADIQEKAHAQGYESGLESAREEIFCRVRQLEQLVLSAREEKARMMRNAEAEVIDLATRIAEKILDEQIKVDPEVVVAVAKRAIELAIDREHIVVRINPADREMMRRHKAEMFASTDGVKNIQVVADQGVRQGGCIIETNSGNVDAQLASQLAQVEECLRGAIDGERGQPN